MGPGEHVILPDAAQSIKVPVSPARGVIWGRLGELLPRAYAAGERPSAVRLIRNCRKGRLFAAGGLFGLFDGLPGLQDQGFQFLALPANAFPSCCPTHHPSTCVRASQNRVCDQQHQVESNYRPNCRRRLH